MRCTRLRWTAAVGAGALATATGAVLPFLVLVLAVGGLGWWAKPRLRPGRPLRDDAEARRAAG